MCSACITSSPPASNSAVEQSRRSVMLAECAERISTAPISSQAARSAPTRTCSETGSSPRSRLTAPSAAAIVPASSTSALQPGGSTRVASGSSNTHGPAACSPGRGSPRRTSASSHSPPKRAQRLASAPDRLGVEDGARRRVGAVAADHVMRGVRRRRLVELERIGPSGEVEQLLVLVVGRCAGLRHRPSGREPAVGDQAHLRARRGHREEQGRERESRHSNNRRNAHGAEPLRSAGSSQVVALREEVTREPACKPLTPVRFRSAPLSASVHEAGGRTRDSTFPVLGRVATITYTLSGPGSVRFTVERVLPGRRRARRCVAPDRASRRRRCTRAKKLRGVLVGSGELGANKLRFNARLRGRRLARGRYILHAIPLGPDGKPGARARTTFRVA